MAGDAAPGDSFNTSLGRVRSRWAWLTLALSLLTYGLGSFLQHEIEPFLSVWQIAWVTLPLTLAVAGIAFLLFIRKLTFWRTIGIIFGTFLASLITGSTAGKRVNAYLAVTLRHWAGPKDCTKLGYGLPDFCLPDYSAGHLVVSHPHQHFPVVDLVVAYWQLYGWIGSLKAVLVGCFVGYVLVLMYRPILRARHTPAQAVRG